MKTKTAVKEVDHAKDQAKAQLESIQELLQRWEKTEGVDSEGQEKIEEEIHSDPLSVEMRSGWYMAGQCHASMPEEFNILLCTGGPAVRIIGGLDAHCQPESVRLEYQDWGTPWTEYRLTREEERAVLSYSQFFYYGE